jgi:hypothetical protein
MEGYLGGTEVYGTDRCIPNAGQTSSLFSLKTEIVRQLPNKPQNCRSTYIDNSAFQFIPV